MKLIHLSDTNLGFNDLDILNDENINQREADFYDAFSQVIEQIKIIKPDYIIHTGNLFYRSSPSNRTITFALEQFKIIDSLNIPFILIAGNHSTPRENLSSSILKIFDSFKNIFAVYNQEYAKIEFEDVIFHTLAQMNDDSKSLEQIEICEAQINTNKKNIMMMHCCVGDEYLMQEFGEWVYPSDKEYIFQMMDYVALGHWHKFEAVGKHENVYYSGSTERTSQNDKHNPKGFVEVRLGEVLYVEYKKIEIRPIVSKEIDCERYRSSLGTLDITDTSDAIVKVTLKNLTALQSIEIQNVDIKNIFPDAMSVSIKREFKHDANNTEVTDVVALGLEEYFIQHMKENVQVIEFDRLKSKVQELFANNEEVNNDTH